MKWFIVIALAYYMLVKEPAREGLVANVAGVPFEALARAIQTEEGYFPGSRAYRNNNPGNLRYVGQEGAIGADSGGFAIFPDYQSGFAALVAQLRRDAERHPGWSLWQFVSDYAPASDNNNVLSYVSNIVSSLQSAGFDASTNTVLGSFV